MKLIDIDRIHYLENQIYYIKEFDASVIVLDNRMQVRRYGLQFAIEYRPLGDINIVIKSAVPELTPLMDKIKKKIQAMDQDGVFINENDR